MIYIALEPMLDEWRDWVADTVILFGATRTTVSYDDYTGIPDSLLIESPAPGGHPGVTTQSVQFYVGDTTLQEWRTDRYNRDQLSEWKGEDR